MPISINSHSDTYTDEQKEALSLAAKSTEVIGSAKVLKEGLKVGAKQAVKHNHNTKPDITSSKDFEKIDNIAETANLHKKYKTPILL